ncbi:hypothetical protein HMI54_007483 [Coelomomyces lativittatus]|nr:hypothetical protein HMI55_002270 [Coelomomyces lativittatus]KAJ1504052.1 hypothetical protein HMI54_007483 [Coelomomyces lativittatus]KAJ1506107.1 hypothetical protein HMI56_000763 [Coelomomyces lativittatus]
MLKRSRGVYDLTSLPSNLPLNSYSIYVDLAFTQVPAFSIQVDGLQSIASFQESLRHLLMPQPLHQYQWWIYKPHLHVEIPFTHPQDQNQDQDLVQGHDDYLYQIIQEGDWVRVKWRTPPTSSPVPSSSSSSTITTSATISQLDPSSLNHSHGSSRSTATSIQDIPTHQDFNVRPSSSSFSLSSSSSSSSSSPISSKSLSPTSSQITSSPTHHLNALSLLHLNPSNPPTHLIPSN